MSLLLLWAGGFSGPSTPVTAVQGGRGYFIVPQRHFRFTVPAT